MTKKSKRKEPPHQPSELPYQRRKRQKMSSQPGKVMHDFSGVKAWVAYHEEYQVTTKLPANLTANQIKVLAEYRPPTQIPLKEPEIGVHNWVSQLQEHIHGPQTFPVDVKYEDKQGLVGPATWLVTCHFTQAADPRYLQFPNKQFGYVPLVHASIPGHPALARKKDAKQYAAKCCIEWLVSEGRMPRDAWPQDAPYARQLDSSPLLQPQSSKSPAITQQDAGKKPGPNTSVELVAGDKTSTERVVDLCRLLNIPAPKYEVAREEGSSGMWSCRPKFSIGIIPEEIGVVDGIYPKRAARTRSAEDLEKYLKQMLADRDKESTCAEESSQLGSRSRD